MFIAACRKVAGDEHVELSTEHLLKHPAVVGTVKAGLARMNAECKGRSMQGRRVLLMAEPSSVDGQEITDKATSTGARRASGAGRWSTGLMRMVTASLEIA